MALHALSLFSGIGGHELALDAATGGSARTVCYVEREAYAAAHLVDRMAASELEEAPIWDDITTFDGRRWRGVVDCVVASYPCQPFSVAGKMLGKKDPRYLWPHVRRIIGECKPWLVWLENNTEDAFEEAIPDLESRGFRVAAGALRASDVGAGHYRRRIFVLAYDERHGLRAQPRRRVGEGRAQEVEPAECVAGDRQRQRQPQPKRPERTKRRRDRNPAQARKRFGFWSREPRVARVVHGIPDLVADVERALGNAVVPLQAAVAFRVLAARLGILDLVER